MATKLTKELARKTVAAPKVAKKSTKTFDKGAAVPKTKKVASQTPKLDELLSQGNVRREWDSVVAESLAQEFAEVYGPKLDTMTGTELLAAIRQYVRFCGYKHLFRALKQSA